jgi:DNA-binding response OmpR family regulator
MEAARVSAPRRTVLLVEDDEAIGQVVAGYLEQSDGWTVVWARSGEEALALADDPAIRIVVLDVGLPGIDGFDVCRALRSRSRIPIIMLTARDEESDRVVGLEIGADDYMLKPFSPRELAARLRAILRRAGPAGLEGVFESDGLRVDRDARELTLDGQTVELTIKEFDLLTCLIDHPRIVLSRERLLELVWGLTYPGGTRTVDVHVAQLRRKLGPLDPIKTVRGAGYKFVP